MSHPFGLTWEILRRRRRSLEDLIRKSFLDLERSGKLDEAEDLEIRLRDMVIRKMADYQ